MTAPTMEQAVDRNYEDILRYFIYRVRSHAAAEDLTQETFYRFLRYSPDLSKFRTAQKCRAYLFAIASNVYRNYSSRSSVDITDLAELDESLPAEDNTNLELADVIRNALAKLPDAQRETAILYYYGEFKIREISKIQDVSIPAVKNRLKTARNTLRILLEKEGFS